MAAVVAALAFGLHAGSALAEVVVVVSARSSVTSLTRQQVADIFLGKTNRFPGGGAATPIDHAEDAAIREQFYARFTGKSPSQVKAHWSKILFTGRGQAPRQAADVAEVRKLLAADPNAISYADSGTVDASLRVVATP